VTSRADFERGLRSWLQEDGHEDPARVLARVEALVAQAQRRRGIGSALRGRPYLGRSLRLLAVAAVAVFLVVGALGLLKPWAIVGPAGSPTLTPSPSSSAIAPSGPVLANDEPCTRTMSPASLALTPNPFHHEDLERMVLSSSDVGGLDGFEPDIVRQGYHDNAELMSIEVNPSTTCQDIQQLGRIEGYGNAYTSYADGRAVLFAVHLFWTPEEAAAWIEAFNGGLASEAAASSGAFSFEVVPSGPDLPDAMLVQHSGADGIRTWAILQRGPIVGWIVDLHRDQATIDVPAAVAMMAERIETVAGQVAGRARGGLDVAQLLSAPLPKTDYGTLATDFIWDPFFGGCQDTAERGFIAGGKAAADAARFDRLTGCTAMYAPLDAGTADVVRVFSSIHVHGDSTGASEALAANVEDQEARGGVRFTVDALGEEAIGISTPASGEFPADTRVVMRIGNLMTIVAIQGDAAVGQEDYVQDLATRLEERVNSLTELGP
jgi:hypothetical protein